MSFPRAALWLGLALAAAANGAGATGPERALIGRVCDDANGDGRCDSREAGVALAVLSDQHGVVKSAADGTFRLAIAEDAEVLSVRAPAGWTTRGPFWRAIAKSSADGFDFPLVRRAEKSEFTFLHASDTHWSSASAERTARLRELVAELQPDFVLLTGDLVRDALRVPEAEARGYYEGIAGELARIPVPVFTVPGNHELFGIERHQSLVPKDHPLYGEKMYRHYFGPNYYAFDFGGVRFVGLDSVDYDDLWYFGHYTAEELAWLGRDLVDLPPDAPVVTFQHIPLATSIDMLSGYTEDPPAPTLIRIAGKPQYRHVVANAAELLAVVAPRRYEIALGGHMHAAESLTLQTSDGPLRIHQTAAVVGPNEGGGVHFPSGVTLYRVRDGRVDEGTFVPLDPVGAQPPAR
ncbi:MAG: metallophosphoesterase [Thermoanaerobaculia bacterium]